MCEAAPQVATAALGLASSLAWVRTESLSHTAPACPAASAWTQRVHVSPAPRTQPWPQLMLTRTSKTIWPFVSFGKMVLSSKSHSPTCARHVRSASVERVRGSGSEGCTQNRLAKSMPSRASSPARGCQGGTEKQPHAGGPGSSATAARTQHAQERRREGAHGNVEEPLKRAPCKRTRVPSPSAACGTARAR
jgi:hypothetical protein